MIIEKMRPDEIYSEILLLREQCGAKFYLERYKSFVKVACPACDEQTRVKFQFQKYGFKHYKCTNCNTLYVNPRPNEDDLLNYYSEYDAPKKWTEMLIKTNNERKKMQFLPKVEVLKDILNKELYINKNLFIDVGAGTGNFARLIQDEKLFKNVVALDISEDCIKTCKQQKLDTQLGSIGDIEDDSADVLNMNDLLEHLFCPKEFLSTCYKKLNKNGIIMIGTPNGEGFDFKILKDKTENITPPEHLQYFNPTSIKIFLEDGGFQVVELLTPGILDVEIVRRQIKDNNFDLKSNNYFLDFLFTLGSKELLSSLQDFLTHNLLSSHMLVVARKKG